MSLDVCGHVTSRPYRDEPAEWCDNDAAPGEDFCPEHLHLHETRTR